MLTYRLKGLTSPLFLVILILMGIGLVQVYSSSYVLATENYGDGLYFFKRQIAFTVLSFFLLLSISTVPVPWIAKGGWILWFFGFIGVLATFIPGFGVRVGGAIRWLQLPGGLWGGIRFEPSEILKFSTGILFGSILIRKENWLKNIHWTVITALILASLLLLLKQPDFGSFSIILFVGIGLLFAFGLRWRYAILGAIISIPTFFVLVMAKTYRRERIISFLDPWSDPEQKGFQAIQSMLSFHSGGFFGVGLGQGQGKLFFLPEAHTDFTAAVLGEEMGFLGFAVVLALYAFVVFRGFQIAIRVEDKFQKAFSLGLSMTFASTVFINAGVVMGLLPTKGLALPFLSYGGSSLVTLCLFYGLLLSIERHLIESSSSQNFRQSYRPKKQAFSVSKF